MADKLKHNLIEGGYGFARTKINVFFYKESGKYYANEMFYTNIVYCHETGKIRQLIENKFPEYGNKNYTFKASNTTSQACNYQLVIRN